MYIAQPAALLLASALFLGCGDSSSAEAGAASAANTATPNRMAPGGSDGEADMREIADHELTLDDLEKYLIARGNIIRASQGMPENDANSLDAMESMIENTPAFRKAVEDAGLDAREYATIAITLLTSAMAAGMVNADFPVDSVATAMEVNPDNVNFILKHEAKIDSLTAKMEAEAAKIEGGN